ncbi:hypothetical protein, partial [Burkholderia multivorans]|uniref:hypothetical protein n=1 Tax=Burkholderia multivorans TaxID=87883 RepID=UPI0021C17DB1
MRVVSMSTGAMHAHMRSRAVPHASASAIAERRTRFGTLACNIRPLNRDDRGGTARVAHHGSEYVLT